MQRLLLTAILLAMTFAAGPAHARTDAELNSKLQTMGRWSNEAWHIARYDELLAAPDLTDRQRARVLGYRAATRGGAGDKLGQVADLDRLVQSYPEVAREFDWYSTRSYAWVQAWHLADRALTGLARGRGIKGSELRDLWELGYWDDVAAMALSDGRIVVTGKEEARDIARKLAETGRGTAQMCVAVMEDKQPCEMGASDPSPQPLQGDGLASALTRLKAQAAAYKTD